MEVRLFTPADLMKPLKSGVTSNEFFLLEAFERLEGQFAVQPKYDGIRVQIHKSGGTGRVVMFSDERREIQDRFPGVVAYAKSLPGDFVIDGEIVKIEEGRPERHDLVSAYVHSKTPPNDDAFHVEAFDLIFHDGQLDGAPLSGRWARLKELLKGRSGKIKLIDSKLSAGGPELVETIKAMSTAEGSMIKDVESHYDKKFQDRWWKWKRQFEIDARVREVRKTETEGVWVYICEVGSGVDAQEIGRTFSTKIQAEVGDIIRVFVDRVRKSAAGKWSWFAPKVFEVRQDKTEADPPAALEKMIEAIEGGVVAPKAASTSLAPREAALATLTDVLPALRKLGIPGLFLVGGIVEHGVSAHDVDIIVRSPLLPEQEKLVRETLAKLTSVPVDISVERSGPSGGHIAVCAAVKQEAGVQGKWVLQRHWWGKKAHFDFRLGSPQGDKMWGWTIFTDPRDKTRKHRTVEKKYHDPRWLTFEGDMQPGEPGNPTANLVAHMKILEGGSYTFGGRSADFVEVFLKDGKRLNGRFVCRRIEGKKPTSAQTQSSPEGEGGMKTESVWIAWLPKDQTSNFGKPEKEEEQKA